MISNKYIHRSESTICLNGQSPVGSSRFSRELYPHRHLHSVAAFVPADRVVGLARLKEEPVASES